MSACYPIWAHCEPWPWGCFIYNCASPLTNILQFSIKTNFFVNQIVFDGTVVFHLVQLGGIQLSPTTHLFVDYGEYDYQSIYIMGLLTNVLSIIYLHYV